MSADERVLLLRGHDPATPDLSYWFTIGGGLESGESPRQAAVRELREETGIVVEERELIGPVHRGTHAFATDGVERRSRSQFFAVALDEHQVRPLGLPDEIITDARWWRTADLRGMPFSHPGIPGIVDLAVAAVRERGERSRRSLRKGRRLLRPPARQGAHRRASSCLTIGTRA